VTILKDHLRRGRTLFLTAQARRLDGAQRAGRLDEELDRLRRIPLLVSTGSATSPSNPKPPPSATPWSPPATNAPP
jgi:hypothetical protein